MVTKKELMGIVEELRRTQEALQERQTGLSTILNHAPIVMVLVDRERRVRKVNRAAAEFAGRTAEEMVGLHGGDALRCLRSFDDPRGCGFGPFCQTCVERLTVMDTIETGNSHRQVEVNLPFLRGGKQAELTFLMSTALLNLPKGEEVLVCFEDITERKQAETALRESEEKYRALFEKMLNGYAYCKILVDENNKPIDFVYLEVNDALERLTGLKREDIIGRKITEAIPGTEESHPELFSIYGKVALTGEPTKFDIYFKPLKIWLTISVYSPQKGYFVAVFDNITERKQAETALKEAHDQLEFRVQERTVQLAKANKQLGQELHERKQAEGTLKSSRDYLKKLNDSIWDVIFTVKMPERVIVYANRSIKSVFGYDAEECVGKTTAFLYPDEKGFLDFGNKLRSVIEKGKDVLHTERSMKRKNGEVFPVEITTTFLKENGKITQVISVIRDITEHKRAKEALKEAHDQLELRVQQRTTQLAEANERLTKVHKAVEQSGEIIFMTQLDGIITYVNPQFEKVYGFTPEEALGKTARILKSDVQPPEAYEELWQTILSGQVATRELINKCKDGRLITIEMSVNSVSDDGGKIIGFLAIQRDITERKQMETALKEAHDQLELRVQERTAQLEEANKQLGQELHERKRAEEETRLLLETTQAVGESQNFNAALKNVIRKICQATDWDFGEAWIPSRDEKVLKLSPAWYSTNKSLRKFGQLSEEFTFPPNTGLPGRVWSSKQPEWLPNVSSLPVAVFPRARVALETGLKSGFGVPIIAGGQVLAVLEFFKLKSQEEDSRLVKLVSSVAIQLGLVFQRKLAEEEIARLASFPELNPNPVVETDINGVVTYLNSAAHKEFPELLTPGAKHPILISSKSALAALKSKKGKALIIEVEVGNVIYEQSVSYIPESKRLRSYIKDITERKQAEEKEKQMQAELALSSRLASIGELAAGVAHEINNPLTGIIGFSQLLIRKSTDEKVRRDLETIHSEGQRVAKIVQNLLTFARRHEPKREYADLNDILQKALDLRLYELKTINIKVVTDLAPGLPKTMVDFGQIQQVFLNIILNAEQAMTEAKRGGKLSIKTQVIKDYIRVSFADDGPGIPAEHLDKLFNPFFTTRGDKGGTGLGLSICHGIITEHFGRLYAKSKPGGATFFIELPLSTEKIGRREAAK